MLVFRESFLDEDFGDSAIRNGNNTSCLAKVLELVNPGGLIGENVFADGFKTVQSLALTSTEMWRAVAINSVSGQHFKSAFLT